MKSNRLNLTASAILTVASAASASAATILWQGGSGTFSSANWTVNGTPNQTHPSFGANNDNLVIHNTTINGGTVTGFNNSLVGFIGGDDSLLITGGASIFGDFLGASQNHANDVNLQNGSLTFSDANAYRSPQSPALGLFNFTGLPGTVFIAQTDNTTFSTALASKFRAGSNPGSFFAIDGDMIVSSVAYNGSNLADVNADLASQTVNGKYFQINESSGTQTLTLIPEPSAALLGALGMLALLRRRR